MEETKFKVWDKDEKIFLDVPWYDLWQDPTVEFFRYTGLKDSDGTEEYFGDVIGEEDGTKRIIEDGCSAVLFINIKNRNDIKYFWQLASHIIIGHIRPNPELLN